MTLASFTVDSGLWGNDDHAFWRSDVIDSSGVILGNVGQGVDTLDPVFFGGRYAVTTERRSITERTVTARLDSRSFRRARCVSPTSAA